jgi:hypothetical protein
MGVFYHFYDRYVKRTCKSAFLLLKEPAVDGIFRAQRKAPARIAVPPEHGHREAPP